MSERPQDCPLEETQECNSLPRKVGSTGFKVSVGVIMFAASCVGAGLYADDRYAKSSDLKAFITSSKKEVRMASYFIRKQDLEDKVFELDLIPENKKTDMQRAMMNRNKAQLQEVNQKIITESQMQ